MVKAGSTLEFVHHLRLADDTFKVIENPSLGYVLPKSCKKPLQKWPLR